MSYRQQLESIFTTVELTVLEKIVEEEHMTSFMRDDLTVEQKRALKSIRDKLRGQLNIGNPKTTQPGKL